MAQLHEFLNSKQGKAFLTEHRLRRSRWPAAGIENKTGIVEVHERGINAMSPLGSICVNGTELWVFHNHQPGTKKEAKLRSFSEKVAEALGVKARHSHQEVAPL